MSGNAKPDATTPCIQRPGINQSRNDRRRPHRSRETTIPSLCLLSHRVGGRVEPDVEAEPPVRRVPAEAEREQRRLDGAGEAHQRGDGVVAREHLPDFGLDGQPDGVAEAAGDGEERADDPRGGRRRPSMAAAAAVLGVGVSEPAGREREAVHEPDLGAPVEGDQHRAAEADQRARQLRSPTGLAKLHHLLPVLQRYIYTYIYDGEIGA